MNLHRHESTNQDDDESRAADILAAHEHLSTPGVIASLTHSAADSSATEIEREARRRLAEIARRLFIQAEAHEVKLESERCEKASSIKLPDERATQINSRLAVALIANEQDSAHRQDLAARWFDAVRACDDLRVAVWRAGNEARRELEADEVQSAETNQTTQVDVTSAARTYLQRTAEAYRSHLARQLLKAQIVGTPSFADSLFFNQVHDLKTLLPPGQLEAVYRRLTENLHINIRQQTNIRLTNETSDIHHEAHVKDFMRHDGCFVFAAPADVRLTFGGSTQAGRAFVEFTGNAAQAQSFAWTSADLAARYPEFTLPLARFVSQRNFDLTTERGADFSVVHQGYAYLFQSLCTDAAWLRETCLMNNRDAERVASRIAFAEWCDVRRLAALVVMQAKIRNGESDPAHDDTAREYAATLTEATGFVYTEATCALELLATIDAGNEFHARLFAVALRELLRTRHGRGWWKQKSARDELIDVWNTGARYDAEQLAALIGAGALDIETLIGNHLSEAANTGET
ncbi:MAG: hypothetical protein MSG64_11500 [Pyrinomonadaceae bacterium MAG19_C2-C3]|nr:hypothetical protein [Pyrinomonadaceae bacterium MAG19_C2-C3]